MNNIHEDTNVFGTIVTKNRIPYAQALAESILKHDPDALIYVLVIDQVMKEEQHLPSLKFISLGELQDKTSQEIIGKYYADWEKLRWTLKPSLLKHLLQKHQAVIYVDPDICFFESSDFLFERLKTSSILLTRHWRPILPPSRRHSPFYRTQFIRNWTRGHFNSAFIGANRDAVPALDWWGRACRFCCQKDFLRGVYDDQKYLDLFPVHFEGVEILQHQGCNISGSNIDECERSLINGKVLANNEWPIVFIHFTQKTIQSVQRGLDPLLKPYLNQYLDYLTIPLNSLLRKSWKPGYLSQIFKPWNKLGYNIQRAPQKWKSSVKKAVSESNVLHLLNLRKAFSLK